MGAHTRYNLLGVRDAHVPGSPLHSLYHVDPGEWTRKLEGLIRAVTGDGGTSLIVTSPACIDVVVVGRDSPLVLHVLAQELTNTPHVFQRCVFDVGHCIEQDAGQTHEALSRLVSHLLTYSVDPRLRLVAHTADGCVWIARRGFATLVEKKGALEQFIDHVVYATNDRLRFV
jgi:hypothetical protein